MEWISVKDKLPEIEEYVIAYSPTFEDSIFAKLEYENNLSQNTNWTCNGWASIYVTHWMPLPNSPNNITKKP